VERFTVRRVPGDLHRVVELPERLVHPSLAAQHRRFPADDLCPGGLAGIDQACGQIAVADVLFQGVANLMAKFRLLQIGGEHGSFLFVGA